jgi:glycosyltransferase involved in cell wall biosynthesis
MTDASRSLTSSSTHGRTQKRRLIFLWTYTIWGGAQVYFFAIIKAARHDWDIIVILPRDSKPDLLTFLEHLEVKYEFLERYFDPKDEPTLLGRVQRQISRIRAELEIIRHLSAYPLRDSVLHIEVAPWQSWILLSILALRRANVFATLHNFRPNVPGWRKLIWWARLQWVSRLPGFHIFASNKDTRKNLAGWVAKDFWDDIRVTYTSVDPVQINEAVSLKIDRASLRKQFDILADALVVLAVGQFVDRKGRWVFLESARQVIADRPDVHFAWIMPEQPSHEDLERIESYDLGDRFHPILSRAIGDDRISILSFFRIGDVFVLPSYVEGLPIALLEAMAIGLPAISTNVYAIPEAVINRETGILVEAGDSEAITRAIGQLCDDPELRRSLATNGSSFVLANFDERDAAAKCVEAYRSCFNESYA